MSAPEEAREYMSFTKRNYIKWILVFLPVVILMFDGLYKNLLHSDVLIFFFDALTFVVIPLICLLYAKNSLSINPDSYGLIFRGVRNNFGIRRNIFLDIMICTVILFFIDRSVVVLFLNTIGPSAHSGPHGIESFIKDSEYKIIWIFYLAITAAVVEEIYFRGLLHTFVMNLSMRKKTGVFLYIFLSGVLFGAIHWEKGAYLVASAVVFGVAAALFYLEYRYLTPLIVAHFFIDIYEFSSY
jgi:membrane protease YdiL (CAAX protease family)